MSQFPTSLYYMFPIINLVIALYKVNTHTLKLCLCHKQWSTSKMREKLQWHHLGLFGQARQSHRHYCKTVFSVQITLIYCPWKKNQCCSPFHFNKCHIFEQACCHSCNYDQVKKRRRKKLRWAWSWLHFLSAAFSLNVYCLVVIHKVVTSAAKKRIIKQ